MKIEAKECEKCEGHGKFPILIPDPIDVRHAKPGELIPATIKSVRGCGTCKGRGWVFAVDGYPKPMEGGSCVI